MARDFDPIRSRIRGLLLNDWDPTNASRSEHAHGEYDSFVDPLHELIFTNNAGEDAIVDYLREREREIMCFPGLDPRRLRPVARKLLALRDKPEP